MRGNPIVAGIITCTGMIACIVVMISLTPDPVAGATPPSVSTLQARTESVITAVKTSQRSLSHIGAGIFFGAGIGSILGSIGVFLYWDNQL
jgi:hypothetical protein